MYSPGKDAKLLRQEIDKVPERIDLEDTKWGEDTVKRILELAKGGKMIRGSLLLDATEAMGGDREKALDYALAVEIIHTGLLIHDDIIDGDPKRRGEDAIHIQYMKRFEEISEEAAEDLAICAGDVCFFLAMNIASGHESDTRILELFSKIFARVGTGQIRDIESSERGTPMNVEDTLDFYRNKTACYTFSLPLRTASIIARDEDSKALDSIGTEIGVLYQMKDDELDFRPEKESGKPRLSDLREGKNTIFTAKMLEKETETEDIEELIREGKDLEKAREIKERIEEEGVRGEIDNMMEERSQRIKEKASRISETEEIQELLSEVTELVIERER